MTEPNTLPTAESKAVKDERARGREMVAVVSQLRANYTKSVQAKVAKILSEEPETRDSDLLLTVRVFERYYPQFITDGGIKLADLFNVPKQYDIQRIRAHIQNTLGLFQASLHVREARLKRGDKKRQKFSREANQARTRTLNIYCDESGKADKYSVVSAFCTVQIEDEAPIDLEAVKLDLGIQHEIKFKEVKPANLSLFGAFFELVLARSEPWSVRSLFLENQQAARRSQDDRVWEMLQFLASDVIAREIDSQRMLPPFRVRLIKDADPGQDALRLKNYEERLRTVLRKLPETKGVEIEAIRAENSKQFAGLQAADLVAGTFSRQLNGPSPDTTPKGEFVQEVFRLLGYSGQESAKDNVSNIDFRDAKRRPRSLSEKMFQKSTSDSGLE